MESYLFSSHYDLVTPDGKITSLTPLSPQRSLAWILIENISPAFVGFQIDPCLIFFNLKSTLAQLGLNSRCLEFHLEAKSHTATVKIELEAFGEIAIEMLSYLQKGAVIGKLFAADERRRVRTPEYLTRMFGRADRSGNPLLSLGGSTEGSELSFEKIEGRTIAFLPLKKGIATYEPNIHGLLPTLAKSLLYPHLHTRTLLRLHQQWDNEGKRVVSPEKLLLARTEPLYIRTVFAHVVDALLPSGFSHTSASILQPDTKASGDIYEFLGNSAEEIKMVPLEFYTLEPHREHVFFSDRDQLKACIDNPETLFKAFETAPGPQHKSAAVFVVKGEQLLKLKPSDWVTREPTHLEFPGIAAAEKQAAAAENFINEQAATPFLKAIEQGLITSEGILLSRYFPSPLMKQMLLNDTIHRFLKRLYFESPSHSHGDYFSHEDRSFLLDLAKIGIPAYWVDRTSHKILQYLPKPGKDSGMFVPLSQVETFLKATLFGIYGSHICEHPFERELTELLAGVVRISQEIDHPLLNPKTPVALVTGGGPGNMSLGNRIAKNLGLLSCANVMDFRGKKESVIAEQEQNPYIDAKMTYRLDRLIERQGEFNLDFPIFLTGGIGTDFEFTLEEARRKVGASKITPVLLFGAPEYWRKKVTARFQCNLASGTIAGSEWVSNCFFCVQTPAAGLKVYRQFFSGTLKIGPLGPIYPDGFTIVS